MTMAEAAKKDANSASRTVKLLTGLGVTAVAALFYQSNQLYEQTKALVQTGIYYTTAARSDTAEKLSKAEHAIARVDKLEQEIRELKMQLRTGLKDNAAKK
ncbi:MAG: hypothetical protein A3J24_10975 [Deltaproteobacteria bacterium RIFCSPLOWO2_02_FULL_53_8]|nr:MAG: hypothetical protein A3J24_10975 [Deltaproteobacteria bacterium RIFCSPLOWO2_02_FULL_53_8]